MSNKIFSNFSFLGRIELNIQKLIFNIKAANNLINTQSLLVTRTIQK